VSHYDTLGVPKDADMATVKRAYRRKSRAVHPDRGGDHTAMVALNRAYQTLSDTSKRARYDETGQDTQAPARVDIQARQAIMSLFTQGIERTDDSVDLIALVREQITLNRERIAGQAAELKRKANRLEARRKRMKFTGDGPNFLDDLLAQQIGVANANAEGARGQIEVCKRAIELLKDFAYKREPANSGVFLSGAFVFDCGSGR
jgi:curved DNA-binding protein CbpA